MGRVEHYADTGAFHLGLTPQARGAPAASLLLGQRGTAAEAESLMREAARRGVQRSALLFTTMWRSVRTKAPIVLADVVALSLSGFFAHSLLRYLGPAAWEDIRWLGVLALLPLLAAYWLTDLYSEIWAHPVAELRQLTRVTTVGLIIAAAGGARVWPFPLWCLAAWPAAIALVPLLRTIVHRCCQNQAWWGYPTLVIGCGDRANEMAGVLLRVPRSGLRPVLVTDPQGRCRHSALRIINDFEMLEAAVQAQGIRHAIVCLPEFSTAGLNSILDRYSELVPHVVVLSDHATLPTLWGASRDFGRLSGLEVRNGLLLATLLAFKRLIDIGIALTVLVAGFPLLLLLALMIKLTSPGPVLYCQTRIGRYGRPFRAWKFRTMRPDSDAMLKEYLAREPAAREEWERDHKLRDDPRVTAAGRILRKTSLDELPQIWNVLCGEMSVVGPRPIVMDEVARYGKVFRLYASVKPGITGLWQTSGRNDVTYQDRVLLDEFFVRRWSPWLDIYILAKTVLVLVNRDGAY